MHHCYAYHLRFGSVRVCVYGEGGKNALHFPFLRKETSVSSIGTPQWKLVGWREGSRQGQLDRGLGRDVQIQLCPLPGQVATAAWTVATSRS